jgi:hypothetical protein
LGRPDAEKDELPDDIADVSSGPCPLQHERLWEGYGAPTSWGDLLFSDQDLQ